MLPRVLFIDDEASILEWLSIALENDFEVETLQNPLHLEKSLKKHFDCIVSDIRMPQKDGFYVLRTVKKVYPDIPVIFITAYGSIESVVEAFRKGATDYILKPFKAEEIKFRIQEVLQKRFLETYDSIDKVFIGESEDIHKVKLMISKASEVDSTVLIVGESGVGKEIVAKLIHDLSSRKNASFLAINCASIPETLLESELFGYKKGAFTGAVSDKKGLFYAASGGTLLLDEIGDLPVSLQAKLLRVLEKGEIIPLGSVSGEKVDVRIIAATHQDLKTLTREKTFRDDLFYRLNVLPIYIPPLREHKEDIPLLVQYFVKKFRKKFKKEIKIENEAIEILKRYDWPGNVRELENLLGRMVILSETGNITSNDIPEDIKGEIQVEDWREIEWKYIKQILSEHNNNISVSARKMGIHPSTLYRKIKKYRKLYDKNK